MIGPFRKEENDTAAAVTPPAADEATIAPGGGASPLYQVQAMERRDADDLARHVKERHTEGLSRRYMRDLTAEKYLVHVDGENDGQWAEIVDGQAVIVPPRPGGSLRFQRNLLRPLVHNYVAYFTASRFRVVAERPQGRKARNKSRVDTLLANHIVQTQRLNSKLAEAMYVAAIYGHCPVHVTWRDAEFDESFWDPFGEQPTDGRKPGYADVWVGDPWATVYNEGATRNQIHRVSYEKVIPLSVAKMSFPHVPWINELEGSDELPSVSKFQRIVRRWDYQNSYTRASAAISDGQTNEENVSLIVEETAPGYDPEYPEGCLKIVALSGSAEANRLSGRGSAGSAMLLHVGPLPCKRLSLVRFWALPRMDDPLGKPYVADLDDLQIQLNQIATMRAERLKKFSHPQMVARVDSIEEDTRVADPDSILFYQGQDRPDFIQPPQGNTDFDALLQETESQMFRIGGWQAASRGESHAGDPAAKVVALSKADDTIFGPIRRDFEDSFEELMQLAHKLTGEYAEVPFIAQVSGEEMGYAVEPWIRSQDLSKRPPNFKITSAFGATPESMMQQLQNLVVAADSQGRPLLTAEEFWERVPDPSLKPHRPNLRGMKRRRMNAVNAHIESLADKLERRIGEEIKRDPRAMMMVASKIAQETERVFPLLRTDNPQMAINALDEVIHDTTSSALVRIAAEMRQARYFQWMQAMAQGQVPPPTYARGGAAPGEGRGAEGSGTPPATHPQGGTPTSESLSPGRLSNEVDQLSSAATAGN